MALLNIVQGVALRCNIAVPASAIGNSSLTVQQVVAFVQDAQDDATERWTWRNLKRPVSTFTGDGATVLFNMPSDYSVLSPSDTLTSSVYPTLVLSGPINEDDLLRLKALPFTPIPSVWRLIGQYSGQLQIEFFPAPALAEVISFVYGSFQSVTTSGGSPYANGQYQADTDLSLIPERVIRLGAIYRWKKSKGLAYQEEFTEYERCFDLRAGQEITEREVRMSVEPLRGEEWWPGTITDLTDQVY
jgi:hypothetical protein